MATAYTETINFTPIGFEIAEELLKKGDSKVRTIVKNILVDVINYTAKLIPREIMNRYDITPGSLNDQSKRARYKLFTTLPTREDLNRGKITIISNRFPVMRFKVAPQEVPSQKGIPVSARTPVTVIVVKGAVQVGRPNVFLARMQSGHIGVYSRKPDATHRMRPDGQTTQLNITEEHMVSVAEMVKSTHIKPIIDRKMRERVEQQWNKAMNKNTWLTE